MRRIIGIVGATLAIVVAGAQWVPLENPAGGPYFGKVDADARYSVKIDNTGDGVEDVAYRWRKI